MDDKKVTLLWERYENGRAYLESSGIGPSIRRCVDFFEGRQWPAPTPKTAGLPRPQVNICKMVARAKCAAVLATPVNIVYQSSTRGMDELNQFALYIRKEMRFDRMRRKAFISGVVKGTYVYHFYWDREGRGMDGLQEGSLRCEVLNPLRVFFADPTECDEQRQRWIMIASRETIDSVRAKRDKDVPAEDIEEDEPQAYDGEGEEQRGTKMCTVLTCYYRKGGEVYCTQATRTVVFRKEFCLTPDMVAATRKVRAAMEGDSESEESLGEDAANNEVPDAANDKQVTVGHEARMYLYPIVVGAYEPREGSIYGIGEVEGLIHNQRIINYNLAMITLNSQQMAWNKWQVLPNALKDQRITNEPGQVLTDYSATGNGIRPLQVSGMSGTPSALVDSLISLTRVVSGSTEVMTGETLGASMSGAAIAQLQSQAQAPIKDLRTDEWEAQERVGRVLAQFFINFYSRAEYVAHRKPTSEEAEAAKAVGPDGNPPVRLEQDGTVAEQRVFDGSPYRGMKIDVAVQATAGTSASAAGDIQLLTDLLSEQALSAKAYVRMYPTDAISDKQAILDAMDAEEAEEINVLRQQVAQANTQLEAAARQMEATSEAMDSVQSLIQRVQQLEQALATLYAEAKAKVEAQAQQIQVGNASLIQTVDDAEEMARMIVERVPGAAEAVQAIRDERARKKAAEQAANSQAFANQGGGSAAQA